MGGHLYVSAGGQNLKNKLNKTSNKGARYVLAITSIAFIHKKKLHYYYSVGIEEVQDYGTTGGIILPSTMSMLARGNTARKTKIDCSSTRQQ